MVWVQDTGPSFHGDLGIPMAKQLTKATQGAHDVENQARTEGRLKLSRSPFPHLLLK